MVTGSIEDNFHFKNIHFKSQIEKLVYESDNLSAKFPKLTFFIDILIKTIKKYKISRNEIQYQSNVKFKKDTNIHKTKIDPCS